MRFFIRLMARLNRWLFLRRTKQLLRQFPEPPPGIIDKYPDRALHVLRLRALIIDIITKVEAGDDHEEVSIAVAKLREAITNGRKTHSR